MKKIKKFIRYISILCVISISLLFLYYHTFNFIWRFNLLKAESYKSLYTFWENGGVFKTFKDCSLLFLIMFYPLFVFYFTNKLYKKGFWATILKPFIKLYRKLTKPKPMDDVHIVIKNLGAKSEDIDELITDKLKEKGVELKGSSTIQGLRQQISSKIEENEKK